MGGDTRRGYTCGMPPVLRIVLLALSGILFVLGYVPYILSIVRRKTTPSSATWLIWSSMDVITLVGMYVEHAANPLIIGATIGSVTVAILAFIYGTAGWNLLDKLCLGGAALSLFLWWLFQDPIYGIMTALGVNVIGAIPTFVSSWNDPSTENRTTWALFWTASLFGVLVVPAWTLADAAQPISFLAIQSCMIYLLFFRRHRSAIIG